MKKNIFILGLFVLALLPLSAQKKVTPLPVDSGYVFGPNYFFYALPQTVFQFDVTLTRVSAYKGVYGDYADKLLGLSNVITHNDTYYNVKNIAINQISIADTSYIFAVEPSSKQLAAGLMTQLSLARVEQGQPRSFGTAQVAEPQIPDFFRYYADLAYMDKESNYVETQLVDGVVRQVPASKVEKVAKSSQQQAQEAADFIGKIRADRYAVLTGAQEVNYSADAISKMVDDLNELEKNYLGLFTGFTVEEEVPCTLYVIPDTVNPFKQFVFAVSNSGISMVKSVKDQDNYYIMMTPKDGVSKIDNFKQAQRQNKKYKANSGYRIRHAVPVEVSLYQGNTKLYSLGTVLMYQWGEIEILPLGKDDIDIHTIGIIY